MINKAMIMAAGVGSRLGILSDIVPKPLVPIANVPVMDILLKHLSSFGINKVIANTFYKAKDIQKRYTYNNFGIDFNYIEETKLSGTAGGLKKCQFFFDDVEDFIVMSADGLTDIDINGAYKSHKRSNSIITIVTKEVQHKDVSKYGIIVVDKEGFVQSFQEKPSIEDAKSNLANTGIYIFNRKIFDFIPQNTFYDFAKNVFSNILEDYPEIKINTYKHCGYWSDIGSIEQYKQSNIDVLNNEVSCLMPDAKTTRTGKYICSKNCNIDESAQFIGNNSIGKNCVLKKNCIIENSILWDNVIVDSDIEIRNSIVLPNTFVEQSAINTIVKAQSLLSV